MASAQVHQPKSLTVDSHGSYVKSDCLSGLVRPVSEEVVQPAKIQQITKKVSTLVQPAHTIHVIHTPDYRWVTDTLPTDVEEGFIREPLPIYKNRFVPGEYEWQDDGEFELQPASHDVLLSPSGQESKRSVAPIMSVRKKWVQVRSGSIEKFITGFVQLPPAPKGGRLINNTPGVYTERAIPAAYKPQIIVIGQTREPAIIQQSYGVCMIRPKADE